METQFAEFSLVVIANDHNPTVLNPDFLDRNQIVSKDWGWKVIGQSITTPALSTVNFDSKVTLTVEPMKLQVTDRSGSDIESNHACDLMSNYVNQLPHVPYRALGINFTQVSKVDDPSVFIINRFLKNGPWNQDSLNVNNLGLNLAYKLEEGIVTFSIDKGFKKNIDEPYVVAKANFHRDLDPGRMPSSNQIASILSGIESDFEKFQTLHNSIVESD